MSTDTNTPAKSFREIANQIAVQTKQSSARLWEITSSFFKEQLNSNVNYHNQVHMQIDERYKHNPYGLRMF